MVYIVELSVLQIYILFNVSFKLHNDKMIILTLVNWLLESLIYLINLITSITEAKYEPLRPKLLLLFIWTLTVQIKSNYFKSRLTKWICEIPYGRHLTSLQSFSCLRLPNALVIFWLSNSCFILSSFTGLSRPLHGGQIWWWSTLRTSCRSMELIWMLLLRSSLLRAGTVSRSFSF